MHWQCDFFSCPHRRSCVSPFSSLPFLCHPLLNTDMDSLLFNKYRLIRKIGAGCFGELYLGENVQTGDHVAIKLVGVLFSAVYAAFILFSMSLKCLGLDRNRGTHGIHNSTMKAESSSSCIVQQVSVIYFEDSISVLACVYSFSPRKISSPLLT